MENGRDIVCVRERVCTRARARKHDKNEIYETVKHRLVGALSASYFSV